MDRGNSFGFETPEEALNAVVAHLGGPPRVGHRIWPGMNPKTAARKLADCLNPNNTQKLDLGEVILILNLGRRAGCDTGMFYFAQAAGYDNPPKLDPEEEIERLQHLVLEQFDDLSEDMQRLKRMKQELDAQPQRSRRSRGRQ